MPKRIIPEWRAAWRLLTVQLAGAMVLFGAMPVEQQTAILQLLHVPQERLPAVLGVAMLAARLARQRNLPKG